MTDEEQRRVNEYMAARNSLIGQDSDVTIMDAVDATAFRILQTTQGGNLTPTELAQQAAGHVQRVADRHSQGSNPVSEEIMESMKSAHEQTKKGRSEE